VNGTETTTDADTGPGQASGPEPIRFFGTTWVNHDGDYRMRRAGVAAGALLAAAVGVVVLIFGMQGILAATSGPMLPFLYTIAFAVCSVIGFHHTWVSFLRRPAPTAEDQPEAAKGLYTIGFIGVLLAYFARALVEAPGEKLHRAEYEERAGADTTATSSSAPASAPAEG
jgi:hypothetical protein